MRKLITILFLFLSLAGVAQTYQPGDTVWAGPGEYAGGYPNPASLKLYGLSGNTTLMGTGGAGVGGIPFLCVTTPTTEKFLSTWGMLHGFGGIGFDGFAQFAGDNTDGEYGDGTSTSISTCFKLLVDGTGASFGNLVAMSAFFTGNAHNGWFGIKSDGTLWVWGNTTDAMNGDGSAGSTFLKPTNIPIPGGRHAIQVLSGFIALVLMSDGTVWSFGSGSGSFNDLGYAGTGVQYQTIHQCTGLSGVTQIAGGEKWNYAITATHIFRWGSRGDYMCKAGGAAIAVPEIATEIETALHYSSGRRIKSIVTNADATACILDDGTLWAWGENVQGGVGNGTETNWYTYAVSGTPFPFQNNVGSFGQLMVTTPVQISNATDWVALYGSSVFCYYFVARHRNGVLATWGRNKGAVALNGIQLATSDLTATYPNSLDIVSPRDMDPFNLSHAFLVTTQWCLLHPTDAFCNEFTHGGYHPLSPDAGVDQTVTTNIAVLNGVVGDTTLQVKWSCGTCKITDSANKAATITNLSAGPNTITFTAVNNGFTAFTDDVIITYTPGGTPCNCITGKKPFNVK